MAVTIEALRDRIKRMERELAEVRMELNEFVVASHQNGFSPTPESGPLADLPRTETKELLRMFDRAAAELGIDVSQPAMAAEAVQEMMLREGVRPEDNILSRGIVKAREE